MRACILTAKQLVQQLCDNLPCDQHIHCEDEPSVLALSQDRLIRRFLPNCKDRVIYELTERGEAVVIWQPRGFGKWVPCVVDGAGYRTTSAFRYATSQSL